MTTKEDVERFLLRMKEKIEIFGIIYRDDRGKNNQTLADLEITPKYRDSVILNLDVKDKEVYIKITLDAGTRALCISFHIAEYKMKYPFKYTET